MRITDIVKADKHYRQWRKAKTLLQSLERRSNFYSKRQLLLPKHINREAMARAELRGYVDAYNAAEHVDPSEASQTHEPKNIYRLDKDEFNSLTLETLLKEPTRETLDWIYEGLPVPGKKQYTDLEVAIMENMNTAGIKMRSDQHRLSLMFEIAYRVQQNYYMIFNTLTVQPESYHHVFTKESRAFKNYIRTFEALSNSNRSKRSDLRTSAPIRDQTNSAPQNTYFACVEEGAKNGRLHIHCLHFVHTLPNAAHDPNAGRSVPDRRELPVYKRCWSYGFSSPIMVRYSPNDAYGQTGFRWPYDNRTASPLKISSPLALGNYMSKYISKSYISKKRSNILWRVRKSHSLGTTIIQELLSTLTQQDLLNISTNDLLKVKFGQYRVPPSLLRLKALQRYNAQRPHYTPETSPSLMTLAQGLSPRPSPLQYSEGSIQGGLENNQRSIGNTRITALSAGASFDETSERLFFAAKKLTEKYFRDTSYEYGTTTIRDYIWN